MELQVKMQGVAPLLFNRMTDEAKRNLKAGTTGGKKNEEQSLEQAMQRVYRDEQGLYLPGWNLKVLITTGCTKAGIKQGRGSLSPYMKATLFVPDNIRFIKPDGTNVQEPDFIHEAPGRVPPRTGACVLIKRPALDTGWVATAKLVLLEGLDPEAVQISLKAGGKLCGLGSWRPDYGRFEVVK